MHPESSASDSEMQAVEATTSNAEDEAQDAVTIKIAMTSIPKPPDCTVARQKVLASLEDLLRPDGRIEIARRASYTPTLLQAWTHARQSLRTIKNQVEMEPIPRVHTLIYQREFVALDKSKKAVTAMNLLDFLSMLLASLDRKLALCQDAARDSGTHQAAIPLTFDVGVLHGYALEVRKFQMESYAVWYNVDMSDKTVELRMSLDDIVIVPDGTTPYTDTKRNKHHFTVFSPLSWWLYVFRYDYTHATFADFANAVRPFQSFSAATLCMGTIRSLHLYRCMKELRGHEYAIVQICKQERRQPASYIKLQRGSTWNGQLLETVNIASTMTELLIPDSVEMACISDITFHEDSSIPLRHLADGLRHASDLSGGFDVVVRNCRWWSRNLLLDAASFLEDSAYSSTPLAFYKLRYKPDDLALTEVSLDTLVKSDNGGSTSLLKISQSRSWPHGAVDFSRQYRTIIRRVYLHPQRHEDDAVPEEPQARRPISGWRRSQLEAMDYRLQAILNVSPYDPIALLKLAKQYFKASLDFSSKCEKVGVPVRWDARGHMMYGRAYWVLDKSVEAEYHFKESFLLYQNDELKHYVPIQYESQDYAWSCGRYLALAYLELGKHTEMQACVERLRYLLERDKLPPNDPQGWKPHYSFNDMIFQISDFLEDRSAARNALATTVNKLYEYKTFHQGETAYRRILLTSLRQLAVYIRKYFPQDIEEANVLSEAALHETMRDTVFDLYRQAEVP